MRAVAAELRAEERIREGRALRVTTQVEFLVSHVLLRYSADKQAPEPTQNELPPLLDLVGHLIDKLVLTIDELYPGSSIPQLLRDADRCAELAPLLLTDLETGGGPLELPLKYQAAAVRARRSRKPNAVIVLVDASALPDGTPFVFRPRSAAEAAAFDAWLAEDPRRGRATWVNNRSKPLLWEANGLRYSPSGLAKDMLNAVGIATNAVQGTSYWYLKDGTGSLVDLADAIRKVRRAGPCEDPDRVTFTPKLRADFARRSGAPVMIGSPREPSRLGSRSGGWCTATGSARSGHHLSRSGIAPNHHRHVRRAVARPSRAASR